jgi:hypothetical protein
LKWKTRFDALTGRALLRNSGKGCKTCGLGIWIRWVLTATPSLRTVWWGRDGMSTKGLTVREVPVYAPRRPTTSAPAKWQAKAVVIGALVILLAMYAALGYGFYAVVSRLL